MREKPKSALLKNLIIAGIILNIFLFGILPLIYLSQYERREGRGLQTLLFGRKLIAEDIDPQYCRDSASYDAIIMIYEGLLAINLSHPEMALYPLLATDLGTYDVSGTKLTFNLKYGVRFHDGAPFNSTAVKWSFDRLAYLMNITGDLPGDCFYGTSTVVDSLYKWPDGTPIINHTEVVSNYVIKFVLNKPYGPFRALLTFPASFIMSPKSTPEDDYINPALAGIDPMGINPNPVAGTGPMILENLDTYEVRFAAFEDYYRPRIGFEVLVHVRIQGDDTRNLAVIAGDIDIITDPFQKYLDAMEVDSDVTLYDAGYGATIQYLGFNNKLYNHTWRKAISWAIDYDYLINELLEGEAIKLKSPIPLGILYANWSFNIPILNLTIARQYMNQMGHGIGFTSDAEWKAVATSPTPFLTINYTYNLNSFFRKNVSQILENNLSKIGIKVINAGMTREEYKDRISNERKISAGWDALQLFWIEWWPEFNDPITYINSLMSNKSSFNSAQINDPILEDYILGGLKEIDQNKRKQLYWDLQKYIVEELCPCAFCYLERNYDVWDKDLHGFPSNALDFAYFYPCYWN